MGGNSATVFVGNIPYDTTEEQLKEIFSQVGIVSSFRLVYEQSTGKPKGYGFCEYEDAETAMSALRNLDGVEVNGRPLRVDLAEHDKPRVQEQTGQTLPSSKQSQGPGGGGGGGGAKVELGIAGKDMINERMTAQQVFDVMDHMKQLIKKNEADVKKLLLESPDITYALLRGQIMLGMISPEMVPTETKPAMGGPPADANRFRPPMPMPGGAPGMPPSTVNIPGGPPGPAGPPVPAGDPAALLQQAQAQIAPGHPDQFAQLQMLMSLTPAQVEQLPAEERALVLQIQRTMQGGGFPPGAPGAPPPGAPAAGPGPGAGY